MVIYLKKKNRLKPFKYVLMSCTQVLLFCEYRDPDEIVQGITTKCVAQLK